MLKRTLLKNGETPSDGEEELSGSDTALSSSPSSTKAGMAGGSELFKAVLDDYIFNDEESTRVSKVEFERYNARKKTKEQDYKDHGSSNRCPSCQAVTNMCRCEMYGGRDRTFGHRVHWADEVWKKPLTTLNEYDSDLEAHYDISMNSTVPKPILKHKATCIIIVSN